MPSKPLTGLIGGLCGTIIAALITLSTNPGIPGAIIIGIAGGGFGSMIGREFGTDE